MFIEQSVARRRAVRRVFLVAAAAPCAILLALAWWRHSAAHVEAVERHAAAHLGVPIDIGSVSHPRPGVMRLSGVVVGGTTAADGGLVLPTLEVETAAGEVRVRVPRFDCAPRGARTLAELAVEWLARPARFPKSWVVDVGQAAWLTPDGAAVSTGAGWHVECVAAAEARAVRIRREPPSRDEIRVRTVGNAIAVEGEVEDDLPVAIASAFAGVPGGWADALGPQARMRGTVEATRDECGWAGSFVGVVDRCALAAVGAGGGRDAEGEAVLTWHALRWDADRIVSCDVGVSSPGGTVSQGLLDRCVGVVGCRPGPAYRALGGDARRPFDELAIRVRFDASGLRFVPVEGRGEGLVRSRGLSLIEPPDGPVSPTAIAWILAPDGRAAVPASPAGAWLISILPESGAQADF